MNKKAHGLIELDTTNLPKWLLYPLIFFICIILLVVAIVLILFIISWFRGDANFMPFGMFGYYGMPIAIGSFSSHTQECSVNGIKVNCSDLNKIYDSQLTKYDYQNYTFIKENPK